MTRFFTILVALIAFVSMECAAQNLVGFNGFYTRNSIALDTSGMRRKLLSEPGSGFGIVYKHMELRNVIGFQAELNFENSGFRVEPTEDTFYVQKLKYLNVPLMAHVDIGKHSFKGILAIGTYASFLLEDSKPETNIDKSDGKSDVYRIYNGTYNLFTYGLCGQLGFAICTKAGIFQFTARASIGMSKMMDMGQLSLLNYMTSRSYGFGASYLVPFGKGQKYYTKREKVKKEKQEDDSALSGDVLGGFDENGTVAEPPSTDEASPDDSPSLNPEKENPETEENWEERMNE